jgi:hypothetical protein
MRKIKIMMMMPLFLAVSLFFAGCNQSADNDDGPSVGDVPLPNAYLNGANALTGLADSISNGNGAVGTISWTAAVNTIQYTPGNGGGVTLYTQPVAGVEGSFYPLVPAGKALILNVTADSGTIVPDDGAVVEVEGSLYLTNKALLSVGNTNASDGAIRLNGGRLFVTQGTTLKYGTAATNLSLILDSANSSALLTGGIVFSAESTLHLADNNRDYIRIDPASASYVNLRDIWNNSGLADVSILQGGIKSTDVLGFFNAPVTSGRTLSVDGRYFDETQKAHPEIPPGSNDGDVTSDPIIIQEGLEYTGIGNQLEHVNLVVNGVLNALYPIKPATIRVGPKGQLTNYMHTTGLDRSLRVESGGTVAVQNIVSNNTDVGAPPITDVVVESDAVLAILGGSGNIQYEGPIDGTLILGGNGYYVSRTGGVTVGGQLVYYDDIDDTTSTVTLNNAVFSNVVLSGGSVTIKDDGAELRVIGNLELGGNGRVLVGGSLAPNYAALELNDKISLTGGFALKPVGGTAAEISLTSDVIINSDKTTEYEKGALLGAGGVIRFTNGASGEVFTTDANDVDTVYSDSPADRFILGGTSLVGTNSVGSATLSLTNASIVFGARTVNNGVSLVNGQYIINSNDYDETGSATRFALGTVYTTTSPAVNHLGIGIGPLSQTTAEGHSLTLGAGASIVFGGPGNDPKYLLVGRPYAVGRGVSLDEEGVPEIDAIESPFAIRGIVSSEATITIPNFLVVGSLGIDNSGYDRNVDPLPALFVNDTDLQTDDPFTAGDITLTDDEQSILVHHNYRWTWGQHENAEGEQVGKWTSARTN